ncbi:MAG: two-component system cell cycle sensor histidine kinase/response regulator CckA [Pseudohongiellaceae bacterium]
MTSYWESRISPTIEADQITGFIVFTNNNTTQKAASIEQQAIFDLSADFLCVLNFDGFYSWVNQAFIHKLGYSEEELLTTPYIELIHPEDRQLTIDMFTRVTDEGYRLPHIAGDKSQLEQVLMNLCVNARDAMPNGGTIDISTSSLSTSRKSADQHSDQVYLDVTDTGGGIAEDVKEKVYNPFFTTKPEGHGTGLGLSMAYGIMQKHSGSIRILRTGDTGTKMQISFPALKKISSPQNGQNQVLSFGGNETILVAEDETLVAKITKETLEKAGYTVILANNGIDAVELCTANKFIELVFMDVMMPEMGGPSAAKLIKQNNPTIPILFASGYAPDSHQAIQDDYIVLNKPYRGDELLNTIRSLLDDKLDS